MKKQRVLVVEDHESLQAAICDLLESDGYEVFAASDGPQALRLMKENRPDLILSDINMPKMDGYELFETVQANQEWVPIPFIFLTSRAERADILKAKMLGSDEYITKPFDPDELLITIRARLERAQAIRKSTEAEFDLLKEQIVTVLGHELRTPLSFIKGYTELALEDIRLLPPEDLRMFLQGIRTGSDRLSKTIDDLLLLVRLDTGHTAEEYRLLARLCPDPGAVVTEVVEAFRQPALQEGVLLKTRTEDRFSPVVMCRPLLMDALQRLVENAIKFSRRDDERWVAVETHRIDTEFQISVKDNGIGIAPEALPSLFQRFQQINRAKMEQQGLGLGLAIAKELITLHNGTITVDSTPGQGSTFTVHLPLAKESAQV